MRRGKRQIIGFEDKSRGFGRSEERAWYTRNSRESTWLARGAVLLSVNAAAAALRGSAA